MERRSEPLAHLVARPARFAPLLLAAGASLSLWYADRGLPFSDEGAQLTAAAKILRGGVFFRDVDAYPWPGATYLLALAMGLLGEHLSVARALAGVFYCGALLALYGVAVGFLERRRAALFGLGLLSLKFLAWPLFSVYMYSDVAFALGCLAIWLFLRSPPDRLSWQLAAAGLCAGLAATAKQNLGLYLGAACGALLAFPRALIGATAPPRARRAAAVACFGLGAAFPLLAMAACFASRGLLTQMMVSGLLRPLTHYLPTSGISFGRMLAWWQLGSLEGEPAAPYLPIDYWELLSRDRLPGEGLAPLYWMAGELASRLVYTSVVVAFGWALARRLAQGRKPAAPSEAGLHALAVLALALFVSALPRADFVHVISVFPLVLLLLLALRRPGRAALRSEAVVVLLALVVTGLLAARQRSHLTYRMVLERAAVDVDPHAAWVEPLVETLASELAPGEPLFVLGHEAHLYFLSGRFSPWPFSQLYPGQTGGDQGRELVRRLERVPPRIVVQGLLRWPGLPELERHAPALLRWVRTRYAEDTGFFERHPPAVGDPPEARVLRVLRRASRDPAQ